MKKNTPLAAMSGLMLGVLLLLLSPLMSGAATAADDPAPTDPAFPKPAADANTYIVGPGDVLQVFVWRNPELTVTVPVRPDGKVSTPLVEDIVATGKTPAVLARDIEVALSEYVRAPRVSVIVTQAQSTQSQIKAVGQFKNPRAMAYVDGMRVIDVVLGAGGLGQYAAGNRARIVRAGPDGKSQEIRVRLGALMEKGDVKQNLVMQPGDILVVPESRF